MELKHLEDKVEELLGIDPDQRDPELTIPENEPTIQQVVEAVDQAAEKSAQETKKEAAPIPPGIKGGYLRQMLNDSDRF